MRRSLFEFIYKLRNVLAQKFKQYNANLPYILTVTIALIIVIIGTNLFIELTDTLESETLSAWDTSVTDYVLSYRNPALTKYFMFVTDVGDLYGYLIVLGIFFGVSFFVFKRWKYVLQTTLVLALASVSNVILKRFIDRARPSIEHLVSVETLSYPSGHAMSAMAFYGFLIYLFTQFKMNTLLKFVSITVLTALLISIGISRIYLGVHFPSDIAGGFIAGFIWVIFCILLFNIIELFKRDPQTKS
ncbi:phosphatase PAP2 family protein [Leeuwenhoekiella marinoflava]|uniref:Undecaprenyl-diphosphatase n=2 Tax=Leeuwenhoekiella marinoflava TaxID=988 RepID=A0A4Q0PPM5_9FLAO|nr:phosphatase PAP2 family protein [Leeuwenhoekiella marinoflava]RXG32529.1 undecaprenyl-diphosphatase [Leeuwenhoekiella marinoflava]SHE68363.1 undecaprenyl-diphosphatase [Leeuwenhoekiella marinoflava DSM 3653]